MIWQTLSTSSAETERLGELLGSQLKGGEVIELRSDLGAGKTTFVKGLAKGAGSKSNVTSPTFTLSRVYPAENLQICHFDFYRLNDPGILVDQLAESITDNNIVIVEWADVVEDVLPADRISVEFKPAINDVDEREIAIHYGKSKQELVKELETAWQEVQP